MGDSLETLRSLREQALDGATEQLGVARQQESDAALAVSRAQAGVASARRDADRARAEETNAATAPRIAADFVLAHTHQRALQVRASEAENDLQTTRVALAEAERRVQDALEVLALARAELRAVDKIIDRRQREHSQRAERRAEAELE